MITFRVAALDDVLGLLNVMIDTNYVQFFKEPYEDEIKKQIEDDNVFVALDDELIVAYAVFGKSQSRFFEYGLGIDPSYVSSHGVGVLSSYRHKGIAFALKKFCEPQLKKYGFNGIYTDVAQDNVSSIRLQEKLGFSLLGKFESSYRAKGVLNFIFVKKL